MRTLMLAALAIFAAPLATLAQVAEQAPSVDMQPVPPLVLNDPNFKDPTNAALLYYRAFMLIPDEMSKKLSEAYTSADANWTPDADLSKMLTDGSNAVGELLRASKIESADFGVEYSQGFASLLPHLGKIRTTSRLLAADARRAASEGKSDDAADRVAAMFAMARHITQERLLISSLVSIAVHASACSGGVSDEHRHLTAAGKQKLIAATDRFDAPDPWGVKAAVGGERLCVTVWIRAVLAQPGGLAILNTQIMPLVDGAPDSPDVKAIKEMDAAAIGADLDKAEGFYSAAIAAFDQPDAQQQLRTLGERAAAGDFGIIAKHAVPAMEKMYLSNAKAVARQSEVRSRLESFITTN